MSSFNSYTYLIIRFHRQLVNCYQSAIANLFDNYTVTKYRAENVSILSYYEVRIEIEWRHLERDL